MIYSRLSCHFFWFLCCTKKIYHFKPTHTIWLSCWFALLDWTRYDNRGGRLLLLLSLPPGSLTAKAVSHLSLLLQPRTLQPSRENKKKRSHGKTFPISLSLALLVHALCALLSFLFFLSKGSVVPLFLLFSSFLRYCYANASFFSPALSRVRKKEKHPRWDESFAVPTSVWRRMQHVP